MSKNIKTSPSFKSFDFLNHYKSNRSKKYIYRCLACYYVQLGKGYSEISSLLQFHKNSIIKWIKKFEEGGLESLMSIKPGRGRKSKLSIKQEEIFASSVVSIQDSKSGGRVTGDDIVKMVKDNHNIVYSRSGMYKLLARMNLSWVSSRSKHPKADEEAQEAFKKISKTK